MGTAGKDAVLDVFARLFRPLMRMALEYGISAGEFASVVRRTYIEALESRFREQKRPTTDARLAVVAGLTRSEVAQVREGLRTGALHGGKRAATLDQITNLLTLWHTHNRFSGAYGIAMDLDLAPTPGSPRRSFPELVDEACPGVDPDHLLDELVASGSIEVLDETTVRCLSRAYVPRGTDIPRIERMGRFLGAVTANFVHNLVREEESPAHFERAVVSDFPLSDSGRDQFLAAAGEKGQALLVELDTLLARLAANDPGGAGRRYGVGIYFFEEQQAASVTERKSQLKEQVTERRPPVLQEIDVLAPQRQADKF